MPSEVHFESENIELDGTLERQTFPGKPNYESIKNGDEIERGWYLRLNTPIDVIPAKSSNSQNNLEFEKNVRIMQLVVMKDNEQEILKNLPNGSRITVRGAPFHRLTGHHHSRVLFEVHELRIGQ